MSFGYCVDDILALIQLSWSAVEGARRACGKHDDLAKEASCVYDVLAQVYSEMSVPEPSIGLARKSMRSELENNLRGCEQQLRIIDTVLHKFNSLSYEQRNGKSLWSKIQFANGQDQDVAVIRSRLSGYSTAISMSLRLMALGSRGKAERQLSRQKGSLVGLRESVNFAVAYLNSTTKHQTLMLAHSKDAKGFWRSLRRELVNDGFQKDAVQGKKNLIISYMKELDSRGILGPSTSFQRSVFRDSENEQSSRLSNTSGSSRSDLTFTDSRTSNTSFLSFSPSTYCETPNQSYDENVCLRTPTWSERSVTALCSEKKLMFRATVVDVEDEDEGYHGSPKGRIPCQMRHISSTERPQTPPTPYDEGIDMLPELESCNSPSPIEGAVHHSSTVSTPEPKIKFEDPHGREFSFPLSQAKTWEGMENLMRKNCAGVGNINAHADGSNHLPYLWEEMASPGARVTIRQPAPPAQPHMYIPPSEEFFLLPEGPASPEEEEFQHLPTLEEWIMRGRTEFTPHSEFVEMD